MDSLLQFCARTVALSVRYASDLRQLAGTLPAVMTEGILRDAFEDNRRIYFNREADLRPCDGMTLAQFSEFEGENTLYFELLDAWNFAQGARVPPIVYSLIMCVPESYFGFSHIADPHALFVYVYDPRPDKKQRFCVRCFRTRIHREAEVRYRYVRKHLAIPEHPFGWTMMSFLQDTYNWCSNCVNMPLFRMMGAASCRFMYGIHDRQGRLQNDNMDDVQEFSILENRPAEPMGPPPRFQH